jgi:predicted GNAT family acetyltransferase
MILDNPALAALNGRQSHLALRSGGAARLSPEYGPFAAFADQAGAAHLAGLASADEQLILMQTGAPAAPAGFELVSQALGHQMVGVELDLTSPLIDHLVLGEADEAEMAALADLTRPGPFARKTPRLGRFVGLRLEGRLAAMAGERLRPDGYTEVSGVCTHPDFQGRGLARDLIRVVCAHMIERGDTPFLHSYAANHSAIALYNRLGFRFRAEVTVSVLKRLVD